MVEIPASIRVGPYEYTIALVDMIKEDGWAYVEWEPRHITVKSSHPISAQRMGLLHEVLHCVNELAGTLNSKHKEEAFIVLQAPLLLDTLQRNPALVAYLMGDEQ